MPISSTNKGIIAFKNLLNKSHTRADFELYNEAAAYEFFVGAKTIALTDIAAASEAARDAFVSAGTLRAIDVEFVAIAGTNNYAYQAVLPSGTYSGAGGPTVWSGGTVGNIGASTAGDKVSLCIGPNYGSVYELSPKTSTGAAIALTSDSNWFFQYQSGVYWRQDITANTVPAYGRVWVYTGKLLQSAVTPSTVVLTETSGSDTITITAPSNATSSYTLTLPTTAGSSGQALTTNGSGVLNWSTISATLGGLTDVTLSGEAEGHIIYRGASNWANTSAISVNPGTAITFNDHLLMGKKYIRLTETGAGSDTITITAPASVDASGWTLTLPENAGTLNYVLTTNGSGATSWQSVGSLSASIDLGGLTDVTLSGVATGDVLYKSAGGNWLNATPDAAGLVAKSGNQTGIAGNKTFSNNVTISGTTTLGSLSGLLKGTTGVVSAAVSGTDYELPLTFNAPLSRSVNAVSLTIGTANQLLGATAAGSVSEWKTISGTSNRVTVTHGVGTITLNAPQDIHTTATPQFSRIGLGTAADGTANIKTSVQAAIMLAPYGASAGNTGEVRFLELAAGGSEYVGIAGPDAVTTSYVLVLPNASDNGKFLKTGTLASGRLPLSYASVTTADITDIQAPGSAGNVLYSNSSVWTSATPDTAGLVAKTGAQTIADVKTFSSAPVFQAGISIREVGAGPTHTITLTAPDLSAAWSAALPTTAGSSGQFLTSGGAGATMTWTTPAASTLVGMGYAATNTHVLYVTGSAWTSNTPDNAGLVAKSGNQTIAGEKTFSNNMTISGGVGLTVSGASNTGITLGEVKASSNNPAHTVRLVANEDVGTSYQIMFPAEPGENNQALVYNNPTNGLMDWKSYTLNGMGYGSTIGQVVYVNGFGTWVSGSPDAAGLVAKSGDQTGIGGNKSFTNNITLAGGSYLYLRDTSEYVRSSAASTLDLNAATTTNFRIGGNNEIVLTDNNLTFQNTTTTTALRWDTAGTLKVIIGSDDLCSFNSTGIRLATNKTISWDDTGSVSISNNSSGSGVLSLYSSGSMIMESALIQLDSSAIVLGEDTEVTYAGIEWHNTDNDWQLTSASGMQFSVPSVKSYQFVSGTGTVTVNQSGLTIAGTNNTGLKLSGTSSGTVTLQTAAAAGTYNFVLPTSAGSSGQFLTSAAGGTLTWTTPSASTLVGMGYTATNTHVLYVTGGAWTSNTPDNAGLVAKSGTQTGIAGDKTFTGAMTITSTGLTISGASNTGLKLSGTTSGTVTFRTAAVAGTWELILPATVGATGNVLKSTVSSSTATLAWSTLSTADISDLAAPGTAGNVLYSNGSSWLSNTPDTAGLVAKSGTQTGIAGDKTFTGNITASGAVGFVASGVGNTGITLAETTASTNNPAHWVRLTATADVTAAYTLMFPGAIGSNNQLLTINNNSTGALEWKTFSLTGMGHGSTDGNVLYVTGSAWTAATPDTAGLVSKSGNQTIADVKTFSSAPVFQAGISIREVGAGPTHTITLTAPDLSAAWSAALPTTAGSSGQFLTSGGAGATMTWTTPQASTLVGMGYTATNTHVLYVTGGAWTSNTPDNAGLVAKSGNQTGIAGNKTFTGDMTITSTGLTISGASNTGLKLSGTTSGTVTFRTAAVAGTWELILPATVGATGNVLKSTVSSSTATLAWSTIGTADISDLGTWTGSANITTVGTISTGTWNATSIAINKGGTGQTAVGTTNQILGTNSGANGTEWKTISGTSNRVTVSHAAGSITLNAPQDIHTTATPQFSRIGLGTAADGTANIKTSAQAAIMLAPYGASAGNTGEVRFLELAAGGSEYVGIAGPDAITTSYVLVLPNASDNGKFLKTGTLASGRLPLSYASVTTTDITDIQAPGSAGNVLYSNSSVWTSATPDTAGLVAKSGNQTIAGIKTFSNNLNIANGADFILKGATLDVTFSNVSGELEIATDGTDITLYASGGGVYVWDVLYVANNMSINDGSIIQNHSTNDFQLYVQSGKFDFFVAGTSRVAISSTQLDCKKNSIRLEQMNSGTNNISFSAPSAISQSWALVLPTSVGATGNVLRSSVSSTTASLEWATPATIAGGIAIGDLSNVVITSVQNGSMLWYNGTNWVNVRRVTRESHAGSEFSVGNAASLSYSPVSGTEEVFMNGVLMNQGAGNDYTMSGSTLTFTFTPETTDVILVTYFTTS